MARSIQKMNRTIGFVKSKPGNKEFIYGPYSSVGAAKGQAQKDFERVVAYDLVPQGTLRKLQLEIVGTDIVSADWLYDVLESMMNGEEEDVNKIIESEGY